MFRIKICGITNVDDALAAAAAGADAIGLNFYPPSPRYLPADEAERIVAALPAGIVKVGVFVNSTAAEICTLADRLRLDLVQLHGDEPPELLSQLGGRPTMRAVRSASGLEPVESYLNACRSLGQLPRMVLVDAWHKDAYGGTGTTVDWAALTRRPAALGDIPLVLAGGLTPLNVGQAIRTVRPRAVDTASGVELSPGRKSSQLIHDFVTAAKAVFADLG